MEEQQQDDEFMMYRFKVERCYETSSHYFSECSFVHPGENLKRRDPKQYNYSYLLCHAFQKSGSCWKGDACEYAHGAFESGLHPSRYRTMYCRNGTECRREVCFFAHNHEELRPLNATTSSALPPPTFYSNSPSASAMVPFTLSSPYALIQSSSMPPWTPSAISYPAGRTMWPTPTQIRTTVPTPQMPSNSLNARDNTHLDMKFFEYHNMPNLMMEGSSRLAGVNPTNLEGYFGSSIQSPTAMQGYQNVNQQLQRYPSQLTNSNVVRSQQFRFYPILNSRYDALSKQSQNFIESSSMASFNSMLPDATSVTLEPSTSFSGLRSRDRKLELGDTSNTSTMAAASNVDEPDVGWVDELVD
ncbi:putative transcription factor C3H family [Medicago truncatula]|uniref:Putative transcription factor C3H family n=1 Tax=Medicago truncatula TaxID=3880 RepID=A0A072UYW3_MEDTR|nr:zinc finger CCCH domain-containing protein 47 [Medicago truncatula]KEH34293.1 zinc finger CCCH domain protein [Medicago truncatula]RHN67665.1 putative transcription factor C3H family [Medicago truncatula]